MRWQRLTVYLMLVLAWAAFAAWQYHEYGHERQRIEETLVRQSGSIMGALIGGIQSHRRLGRFFQDQMQGALDEMVKADDVLAVAIAFEDGPVVLSAGRSDLLEGLPPASPGDHWDAVGFRHVEPFVLAPAAESPRGGGGWGGGRGMGRGRARDLEADEESPLSKGGQFVATLLLDRSHADVQRQNAARLRAFVVLAGAVVVLCVAVAWWAAVRLLEARARAQLLETEARHLRELGQAAAGLAHETRNPLGLIRGWSQRLASGIDSPDERRRAEAVVEECDRVTARINQFFAFAKPCEPARSTVEPDAMVDELAALLEPDLEAKDVTLRRTASSRGRSIAADPELLRQVLFNLLQNAIQFAPEHTAVDVGISLHNGAGRIEVADRGPGVGPEAAEAIFMPYYTTRSGGTGLGLAIVRRIATAHGWRIEYHARPGGGAVFELHLTR
jgi:two-component system, NtrC family, sensor histidine kinase HydH